MTPLNPPVLRPLLLSLLVAGVAGGCTLERRAIVSWTEIAPAQVCPGDTVVASYDFLREETCRDEAACARHHPTVAVSSSPEAFPARTVTGYSDRVEFTPAETTTVHFDIDRDQVRIPTTRVNEDGVPIDLVREQVLDASQVVNVITGTIEQGLVHEGMCAGSTPVNASASLPGPPTHSAALGLRQLCNANGVPVVVTLMGAPPMDGGSGVHTETLMPGECLDTAEITAPSNLSESTTVDVRPMIPDLGARCSALGPNTPPATLRTVARLSCG